MKLSKGSSSKFGRVRLTRFDVLSHKDALTFKPLRLSLLRATSVILRSTEKANGRSDSVFKEVCLTCLNKPSHVTACSAGWRLVALNTMQVAYTAGPLMH
jgi:hypothetical protein